MLATLLRVNKATSIILGMESSPNTNPKNIMPPPDAYTSACHHLTMAPTNLTWSFHVSKKYDQLFSIANFSCSDCFMPADSNYCPERRSVTVNSAENFGIKRRSSSTTDQCFTKLGALTLHRHGRHIPPLVQKTTVRRTRSTPKPSEAPLGLATGLFRCHAGYK